MRRTFALSASLLAGLFLSQILFTAFVYISNQHLYQNLIAIADAGYAVLVPNKQIMPTLLQWTPAFDGGLFFALTIGAGLSIIGWFFVFLWRVFPRYRSLMFGVLLILCGYALFQLNRHGSNLLVTGICLLVPAVSGLTAHLMYGNRSPFPGFMMFALHMQVIIINLILALVWIPELSTDIFTAIRDEVLLTRPYGQAVNDFYYKYTLYPAEAFKSLDQKLLKTVTVSAENAELEKRLAASLREEDYLETKKAISDLAVFEENERFVFESGGRQVHTVSIADFFRNPDDQLTEVSANSDRQFFLRVMTFFSLVFASPLLCLILLHAVIALLLFPVSSPAVRSGTASLLCLAASAFAMMTIYHNAVGPLSSFAVKQYVTSEDWRKRTAALRQISEDDLPFDAAEETFKHIDSPWIAERYWLAKAAGNSRSLRAKHIALALLEDDQPNVACMALYSLGKQNDPSVIPLIIHHIESSNHWYVQWYAYKALKRLGWRQHEMREFGS